MLMTNKYNKVLYFQYIPELNNYLREVSGTVTSMVVTQSEYTTTFIVAIEGYHKREIEETDYAHLG